MSHMQKQIRHSSYLSVETKSDGTQILPDFYFSNMPDPDEDDPQEVNEEIWDFVNASDYDDIVEVEAKEGWIGRISAPGYMDCTGWISGDSHQEVSDMLDELYGGDY